MLAGFAPQAPVPVAAIAALPVLPTLMSSATAEARRSNDATLAEVRLDLGEDAAAAGSAGRDGPLFKLGGPVHVPAADGQGPGPVRVSDVTPAREGEQEAPACRPGDPSSLRSGLEGGETTERKAEGNEAREPGGPVQLPHCVIEIDPDAEDGDVVAAAPVLPQALGSTEGVKQAVAEAQPADTPEQAEQGEAPTDEADAEPAPAAPAPAEAAVAQAACAPPPAPAHEPAVLVTETGNGVGAAVIDPLLPTDTVTFGGDFALLFPPAEPVAPPVPDPVPEAPVLPPSPDPDWILIV